jgi:hypothetical protein
MLEVNLPIKIPLCQWILLHAEERWETPACSRLSKLEQMDSAEQIPPPLDHQPHPQHSWEDTIFKIQHTMGVQQYPYQDRR